MTLVRWMSAEARLNVFGRPALTLDRSPGLKYVSGCPRRQEQAWAEWIADPDEWMQRTLRRNKASETDDIAQRMNLPDWGITQCVGYACGWRRVLCGSEKDSFRSFDEVICEACGPRRIGTDQWQ